MALVIITSAPSVLFLSLFLLRSVDRRASWSSREDNFWWCILYLRLSGKAGLIPTRAVHQLDKVIAVCYFGTYTSLGSTYWKSLGLILHFSRLSLAAFGENMTPNLKPIDSNK